MLVWKLVFRAQKYFIDFMTYLIKIMIIIYNDKQFLYGSERTRERIWVGSVLGRIQRVMPLGRYATVLQFCMGISTSFLCRGCEKIEKDVLHLLFAGNSTF